MSENAKPELLKRNCNWGHKNGRHIHFNILNIIKVECKGEMRNRYKIFGGKLK
jgi:hypothetical protein